MGVIKNYRRRHGEICSACGGKLKNDYVTMITTFGEVYKLCYACQFRNELYLEKKRFNA